MAAFEIFLVRPPFPPSLSSILGLVDAASTRRACRVWTRKCPDTRERHKRRDGNVPKRDMQPTKRLTLTVRDRRIERKCPDTENAQTRETRHKRRDGNTPKCDATCNQPNDGTRLTHSAKMPKHGRPDTRQHAQMRSTHRIVPGLYWPMGRVQAMGVLGRTVYVILYAPLPSPCFESNTTPST
ncbi:uncharacterized protein LACBIDRAFT_296560 [Laccaria bicolor S238N-H82]|uniref:Predicted protein n=1 Tax=Laccaria bicolor (strain S238N-H82 / ATCC MYA-4686) TaxID=486041 RepID=B0D941_LACBS|nr:uncharacterized protein LACBIDRAFT_296560 [Laccaria bicolor S238N-H82]EDR09190.1 predicted protein [Laccaria bicolor S238N-H82]|eukprot:XP_001880503.1 predicted protein [Laccaria bicolor S238N-H82]